MKPSIFLYRDFRQWLRDWLHSQREELGGYTLDDFARDSELSRATLPNVLAGRSPRPATIDGIARATRLTPTGRNYLGLLVELNRAATVDERVAINERILGMQAFARTRWVEDEPAEASRRYLAGWHIPAIKDLASSPDFRADPAWIVEVIRPRITLDEAGEALHTLFELRALAYLPGGQIAVREPRYRTEADTDDEAVLAYYKNALPDLLGRIDEVPHEQRHLMTGTLLLPEALLAEAKAELSAAVWRIAALADAPGEGRRRAYHISVQLLPVSEPVTGPE